MHDDDVEELDTTEASRSKILTLLEDMFKDNKHVRHPCQGHVP